MPRLGFVCNLSATCSDKGGKTLDLVVSEKRKLSTM
jgi:hypothetical protein